MGKLVKNIVREDPIDPLIQIDVSDLIDGVYFVTCNNYNEVFNKVFVVLH